MAKEWGEDKRLVIEKARRGLLARAVPARSIEEREQLASTACAAAMVEYLEGIQIQTTAAVTGMMKYHIRQRRRKRKKISQQWLD